jgi:hypothetical protein
MSSARQGRTNRLVQRHTALAAPASMTRVATAPDTPAAVVEPPATRPTSVRPAAGLCRCVRCTPRLSLLPPRQSALQPTKEDLRLRPEFWV